eukprot:264636_1
MIQTKFHLFLAVLMVVTGTINTLTTNWPNETYSIGSNGVRHKFNHPFVQALAMFLGEMMCLLAFKVVLLGRREQSKVGETPLLLSESVLGDQDDRGGGIQIDDPVTEESIISLSSGSTDDNDERKFNPAIFLIPAMCDMTATSLMYLGLTLTYTSSYAMLRGAVIIFTGILSVVFLGRRVYPSQWVGMAAVLAGLILVGLANQLGGGASGADKPNPLVGNALIVLAQVIVAVQMVVEEKFLSKYNVPALQAVGWEGVWGFMVLACLIGVFYVIPVPESFNATGRLEDLPDALSQMVNSTAITVGIVGNILSIAFFNFSGISVTKEMNATTRMVLDSLRTVLIWAFSVYVARWEEFHPERWSDWLQILGFLFLFLGTMIYNAIVRIPGIQNPPRLRRGSAPKYYERTASVSISESCL